MIGVVAKTSLEQGWFTDPHFKELLRKLKGGRSFATVEHLNWAQNIAARRKLDGRYYTFRAPVSYNLLNLTRDEIGDLLRRYNAFAYSIDARKEDGVTLIFYFEDEVDEMMMRVGL